MGRSATANGQCITILSFNSGSNINWVCLHFLLLLVFSGNAAFGGSIVKYLPGFDGELPFKLETGYITVDESELFYYFIESEGNPKEDPLMIWSSGGPGCSVLNGLIYEIGPLSFNITAYEGGIPQLKYYQYTWTKTASIIFVDAPVGTGFSYATSSAAYPTSDTKSATQTYEFLKKWLVDHPNFLKNQLIIGADSYSGIPITMVVQKIIDGNEAGEVPHLNLRGTILGCPLIDEVIKDNSKIIFSHRIGLISDEIYEAAKTSCDGNYYEVDPNNAQCIETLKVISKCIQDVYKSNILEPKCAWASPEPNEGLDRRSLEENAGDFILSPLKIPELWCRNFNYALSYIWANDETVQNALHIREGSITSWWRCNKTLNDVHYIRNVKSVLDYHRNLSKKDIQVLVYNGDHDLNVPNLATQHWIKLLNLTVDNDWRPWLVDDQVAGYTIKRVSLDLGYHGYHLTYATIKGGGHTPTEYKRREGYEMFKRWIHYYPL